MRFFLTFLVFTLFPSTNAGAKNLAVKGRLLCGDHPAFNTLVRLWPHHNEKGYDVLAQEYTDMDGTFTIKGRVFTNNPHISLKIYHDCDDGMKPGQRKFNFHIPTVYAGEGEDVEPYDFGELNLETRFKHNEERQSIVDRMRVKRRRRQHLLKTTAPWTWEAFESPDDRNDYW